MMNEESRMTEDMKKNRLFTTICLMAAILFTACTQDELAEQGNTLPDGEYPLQIGRVSITAEASEEPWTRVSESTDGKSSVWETNDEFYVKFEGSDEVGIYKITDAATGAVKDVKPIYWKSTQPANIIAWYANPQPNSANWMFLYYQDDGLAYLLRAEQTAAYGDAPVSLQFTHQFAKVRVVAKGTADVRDIRLVNVPTNCYIEEGKITRQDDIFIDDIRMLQVEREGIGTCWEANVGPGVELKHFRIIIFVGDGIMDPVYDLTSPVTTQAGALHTITWTVNNAGTTTIDLSGGDYIINDDRTYYFSGTAGHAIRVTGGKPNIYLEDAQISVSSGSAIDITGGNPTIHVRGERNTVASTDNTGIAVSGGATLTFEGRSTADMLTATAGNGGAGIGSPLGGTVGGNITIDNVTIHATGGSGNSAFGGAGIGSSGSGNCGDVTITDAVIMANGGDYSSGIGMGYGNTSQPSIGKITITNSDVTAKAGRYASAIGFSYTESVVNPTPDYRAGQIIITTDNLETFLSKLTAGGTAHAEFAAYAQRIGVGSHAIPYPPSLLNQDGTSPWEGVVINGTVYADGYE